ncbi:unnamed protein product [Ilex paraguariensis]|uniref:Alcohol dehydrogenase n=1 Tax=Ilex paraguariensis TaxID=185542 RepID=A0ABC8RWU3_9AQUA
MVDICITIPTILIVNMEYGMTGRKMIAGSMIGGMKDTEEMLEFVVKHIIKSDIELIFIQDVNKAMKRLVENKIPFRFVIYIGNTLKPAA